MFWFGLRRTVLQAQPLCVECLQVGRIEPTREVHHVIPLRDDGVNDVTNLVGLCKPHHLAHTAREGPWGRR
jgi:5-methylcytosine-specific restriction protein A